MFSIKKYYFYIFALFVFGFSFFVVGGAEAATCTWTASSSANMSDVTNWTGAGCDLDADDLVFDSAVTTTGATWDSGLAVTVASVTVSSTYTGTITVNADATPVISNDLTMFDGVFTNNCTNNFLIGGTLVVYAPAAFNNAASTNILVDDAFTNSGTFTDSGNLTVGIVTGGIFTNSSGGVYNKDGGTLIPRGNFANAGTFTDTAGTVIPSSTSASFGGAGNTTLYNLSVSSTLTLTDGVTSTNNLVVNTGHILDLATSSFRLGGNLSNFGVITQSAGTLTMSGTTKTLGGTGVNTFYNVFITGSVTLGNNVTTTGFLHNFGGTLDLATYDWVANGGFYNSLNGVITQTSGTVTMNGEFGLGNDGTGTIQLYALNIAGTVSLYNNVTTTATTTISGTLNGSSKTLVLSGSGTPLSVSGTFNPDTSTVVYSGTSTVNISTTTYYNLTINTNDGVLNNNSGYVTTTNNLTIGSGSTLTVSSTNVAVGGNLANSGVFTQNAGGGVHMTGTGKTLGGSGVTTANYITLNGASISLAGNVTSTNAVNVTNSSSFDLSTYDLIVGLSLTPDPGCTITQTSGTVTMSGTANIGGNGSTQLSTLNITGTITMVGNVTTTATTTISGTLNGGDSKTLTLSGSGTPLNISGTFNANTSTVVYSGSSATNIASTTYYNLTVNGTDTLNGNVTTTNDLTVNSGKSLDLSSYNMVIGGNLLNSGTVSQGATVTMNGTDKTFGGSGQTSIFVLAINGTITLTGNVTTTNNLSILAGKTLNAGGHTINLTGTGTPLLLYSVATFNVNTSTVVYSGATANITSATYYNLTVNGADTLAGSVTTTNVLTINASKSLNAGAYTIVLSDSDTPFVNSGTFTSASSTVSYTNTGSVTPAGATYWDLILGAGTYTLSDDTTSTNSFTNGGTATIASGKTLSVPGTFDNNGTITETGAINHPMTSAKLSDSSGNEQANFGTGSEVVYITVNDDDGNLQSGAVDTITVGTGSTITTDGYNDSESITSVTLTETGADTGIFIGTTYPFQVVAAKTNNNSKFDVSNGGTLTLAFIDDKDASDTGADTATFTGSTYTAPSTGGSGGVTPVIIPSVMSGSSALKVKGDLKETTSQKITLQLNVTNAVTMAIANEANFAGASWEQYNSEKEWMLSPGDGEKTVYVKFRSVTGGETGISKITITLKGSGTTAVVSPAVTKATTYKFTKTIYPGATGTAVKELQKLLQQLGYYTAKTITGKYDASTKAAVIKFQKAKKLKPYPGWVGPATVKALNALTTISNASPTAVTAVTKATTYKFTKTIYPGATGTAVKELQKLLQQLGYYTAKTITGKYDASTKAAVIKFQKAKKLKPYPGWVGPGTVKALNSL